MTQRSSEEWVRELCGDRGQEPQQLAYQELANARGLTAAQILLTLGDTENRRRYLNARNTLETLLRLKAVSYTHLRAHETVLDLVCRLLLEQKNLQIKTPLLTLTTS